MEEAIQVTVDYTSKSPVELMSIIDELNDSASNVTKLSKAYETLRLALNESILHETIVKLLSKDIIPIIAKSFQINDPMLDYEILWALTNLTALLRPAEIESLFSAKLETLQ